MSARTRKILFVISSMVLSTAGLTVARVWPQAPELALLLANIGGFLGGKELLRGSKPKPGELAAG